MIWPSRKRISATKSALVVRAIGQADKAVLTMRLSVVSPSMQDIRTFLGGAVLAAAALGLLLALAEPLLAVPAALLARVATGVEIIGSLVAGIAAVWSTHKRISPPPSHR